MTTLKWPTKLRSEMIVEHTVSKVMRISSKIIEPSHNFAALNEIAFGVAYISYAKRCANKILRKGKGRKCPTTALQLKKEWDYGRNSIGIYIADKLSKQILLQHFHISSLLH